MLLLRLWNYLRGYVIISVKGYFIEKFINLCANKSIYLWDIKKKTPHNMTLKISIKGFKALRGIARKTKCKVEIVKKVGLPFVKYKYRKRKSFAIGFVIFFGILYILSCFIWVIEITGTQRVNPQTIIDFLAQRGIKPAILKYGFDKDSLKTDLLINIPELSWVDVKFIGTKVLVETVERIPKPEIVDRTTPCNIYAKKSGVVKSVIAKNGTAVTKPGNVIKKGQLLISGIVENRFDPADIRYVHADGPVNAVTWYEETAQIDISQQRKERTGEYETGFQLKVFSDFYNLYNPNDSFEHYDTEDKSIRLGFWKNYELPIEFVIKKYYKVNYNTYTMPEENVKEACKQMAFEKLQKIVPKEAVELDRKIQYEYINNNQTIQAQMTLECLEDIGYKEKIIIS
jgi:similar to stage IV sporulation protein